MQKGHTKGSKREKQPKWDSYYQNVNHHNKKLKINHEVKLKKKEKEMIGRTVHVCYEKNEKMNYKGLKNMLVCIFNTSKKMCY